jgi:hypothetical protein
MMESVLKAVALGAAWTAVSGLDRMGWDWIFGYVGFPFHFAERHQGDVVVGFQDPIITWRFLGCIPLIADWLIWTALAWVCLRLVKGTASALCGATAVYCVWTFLIWRKVGLHFGWAGWLIIALGVSPCLLLGIPARWARVAAPFLGVGLFAWLIVLDVLAQDANLLMSGIIFKIPIAVLLLVAVWFALRHQAAGDSPRRTISL